MLNSNPTLVLSRESEPLVMVYRLLPILLLMTLAFRAAATPDNVPMDGTIAVIGIGEAVTEPDLAIVNFAVVTYHASLAQALSKNNQRHERLLATLRTHGVTEPDLRTVHLHVGEYPDGYPQQHDGQRQQSQYEVQHWVRATLRDIDRVGPIVTEGLKHANRLLSIAFESSVPQQLAQEARLRAFDNAYEHAGQYAKRAGVSLGSVLSISEDPETLTPIERFPDSPLPMDPGMYGSGPPALPIHIERGVIAVRTRIHAVFKIDYK